MAVPANFGAVMELCPDGENVSFLVRVIPHPRVCYIKVTPAKFLFPSAILFCHSGHD